MGFDLEILGNSPLEHGDLVSLHDYTFPNGGRFPKSYIDFVRQYGYGLSMGLFIIYIPMWFYGDSFLVRSEEIIGTYKNVLDDKEELWFDLEPDGSYEMLKNLIPFATSENGHYLFWDTTNLSGDEFSIFITDFKGLGFTKVADNLYDFFEIMTGNKPRHQKIITFVLSATFKPFEIIE
jgi:hypothetical protein